MQASSTDVDDPKKPLSHAFLVKAYAEGLYPYEDALGLEAPNEGEKEMIQPSLFGELL